MEQNTTKNGRVDENMIKFKVGSNDKEYEVEGIKDSAVYAKESATGHLPGLYSLVA